MKIFYPEYTRKEVVEKIKEAVPKLKEKLPIVYVVLFGSYAKGNYTAFSDIDLLVVYEDPPVEDAYKIVRKTIDLRGLEPHVYSMSEYEKVRDVIDKMTESGVVIFKR